MTDSMITIVRIGVPVGAFVLFLAGVAIVALVKRLFVSRPTISATTRAATVLQFDRPIEQEKRAA